jgi:hypothetical protein
MFFKGEMLLCQVTEENHNCRGDDFRHGGKNMELFNE